MLGGEMQLISDQNVGSTFYVYLPENFVSLEQTDPKTEGKSKGTTMMNYRPMDDRAEYARRTPRVSWVEV